MTDSEEQEELRKIVEEMQHEESLPVREKIQRRVDRIISRRPGLLREAAIKALAEQPLSEDEFVLTHVGFLPDEWTEEMESEWSVILERKWKGWSS